MTLAPRSFPETTYPDQRLTGLIVAAGYAVHRALGFGFLEAVYRKALVAELIHAGAHVEQEVRFDLTHRGIDVGIYRADIVAEGRVIVEVKTGLFPDPVAGPQLLNYLSASRLELGLVLNFGPDLHIKRMIHSENARRRQTK
jgi:GxxExxY protein